MTDTAQNITRLRGILFDTLDRLADKENPMPIDRAKAVCEVAQVLVNTAKVEIEHQKLHKGKSPGTGFLDQLAPPAHDNGVERTVTQTAPGVTVTRNTLR